MYWYLRWHQAAAVKLNSSPLWSVPCFTLHHLGSDFMHTHHGGIILHFVASVFYLVLYHSDLPGTVRERLDRLWSRVQHYYNHFKCTNRLSALTLGMFLDTDSPHGSFPHLSASHSEARDLIRVIHELVPEFRSASLQDVWDHLAICTFDLVTMENMVSESWAVPTAEQARRFKTSAQRFLKHYAFVGAQLASSHNILAFNVTVKCHQLYHLSEAFAYANLSLTWCYSWENFVARMSRVARASRSGQTLLLATRHMADKYSRLLALRMLRKVE